MAYSAILRKARVRRASAMAVMDVRAALALQLFQSCRSRLAPRRVMVSFWLHAAASCRVTEASRQSVCDLAYMRGEEGVMAFSPK